MIARVSILAFLALLTALIGVGARCAETATTDPASEAFATEDFPTGLPRDLIIPTNFPTPAPVPTWDYVLKDAADDVEEAAGFARDMLSFKPPLVLVEPDSLSYVQATIGDARAVLDPDREDSSWAVADDASAVIFVASGRFRTGSIGAFAEPTPQIFTRLWIVVPLGERGTEMFWGHDEYDLGQLGEVHEVPLPLPPFPTPVSLGTPEAGAGAE